ncbi:metallophosphoesterase [Corallibacter sp.]|uniref:metallophosphoesterase n=1 Tax=Corallibacter sp. TaxID=2038084 RepID=UPI003AB1E15D
MKSVLKKILKWCLILFALYMAITTIILGYQDTDTEKGIYNFYWSGINAFWKNDKPFGFKINQPIETKFNGADGPYVYKDSVFSISKNNALSKIKLNTSKPLTVVTNNTSLPSFTVSLNKNLSQENDHYDMPEKLIAISDIEGNFDALYSFLLANNVIDKQANWIFNEGHLVCNGDFFDRGSEVTQVLWLIYHLENQALLHGGKVHFIMGNHEIMNLYGHIKYNDQKYIHAAKQICKTKNWNTSIKQLYSQDSELGRWLRTKNIVEKIGTIIFVHGGLNKYHLENAYDISELNTIARKYYGKVPSKTNIENDRDEIIVSGINSPFWDRRLNLDTKHKLALKASGIDINPTTQETVNAILKHFKASKIVIGHSLVNDIQTDYNGKVIKIDVKHGLEMNSGKTKGLLIENNNFYKINDLGDKLSLKH